jgi:hypothetical protein
MAMQMAARTHTTNPPAKPRRIRDLKGINRYATAEDAPGSAPDGLHEAGWPEDFLRVKQALTVLYGGDLGSCPQ